MVTQFSLGCSTFSITSTCTGPFVDSRRKPSCSVSAVKMDGPVVSCDWSGEEPASGAHASGDCHLMGISPSFFETMGIRHSIGRGFTEGDDEHAPAVAVVNESMARRYFGNVSPLGSTSDGRHRGRGKSRLWESSKMQSGEIFGRILHPLSIIRTSSGRPRPMMTPRLTQGRLPTSSCALQSIPLDCRKRCGRRRRTTVSRQQRSRPRQRWSKRP